MSNIDPNQQKTNTNLSTQPSAPKPLVIKKRHSEPVPPSYSSDPEEGLDTALFYIITFLITLALLVYFLSVNDSNYQVDEMASKFEHMKNGTQYVVPTFFEKITKIVKRWFK